VSLIPGITVTFDLQGGTSPDAGPRTYALDDLYGPLPVPTYEGHTFSGWFTSPLAGGTRIFPDWRVLGSDHTLYAIWDMVAGWYTRISFSTQGGISTNAGTRQYSVGEVYGPFPDVVRMDGKVLKGWYTEPILGTRVYEDFIANPPDRTLYAQWEDPSPAYGTIYFLSEGGTLSGQSVFYCTDSGRTLGQVVGGPLPVPSRDGYVFRGWWSAPSSGGVKWGYGSPVPVGGTSLYARWEAQGSTVVDDMFRSVNGWVSITLLNVENSLPAALLDAYRAWLTGDVRKHRLSLILEGVMFDYRGAVDADNHPVGELDPTAVPVSLLRNVLTTIWYTLGVEMGIPAEVMQEYRTGWLDSNVVLRTLFLELRTGRNRFRSGLGWAPTYRKGPGSGTSYAAGAGGSGGDGGGRINLGLGGAVPPG